jgi:NADH:ubiquinone oxidoreductase subunit 6 (subunit J)
MKKNIFKNWKTSLAGFFGIFTVIAPVFLPEHANTIHQATALAVSLGLIAAKDGDKTGL